MGQIIPHLAKIKFQQFLMIISNFFMNVYVYYTVYYYLCFINLYYQTLLFQYNISISTLTTKKTTDKIE